MITLEAERLPQGGCWEPCCGHLHRDGLTTWPVGNRGYKHRHSVDPPQRSHSLTIQSNTHSFRNYRTTACHSCAPFPDWLQDESKSVYRPVVSVDFRLLATLHVCYKETRWPLYMWLPKSSSTLSHSPGTTAVFREGAVVKGVQQGRPEAAH